MINISSYSNSLIYTESKIWQCQSCSKIYYPENGNNICFQLEDNSFWFQHRNKCITQLIKNYPPLNDGPIFDIGGGNGFVSKALQNCGFKTILVEPGAGTMNALKRGIRNVIKASFEDANFFPSSLPAVGIFDVLEHIENEHHFLSIIRQKLIPNGKLYLSVPSYMALWSHEDDKAEHFRRYTISRLKKIIRRHGFAIDYSSYFFFYLPLPIFFFRCVPYRLKLCKKGAQSIENEKISHTVNRAVYKKILSYFENFEVKRITQGKTIPFGGSIILSAHRI